MFDIKISNPVHNSCLGNNLHQDIKIHINYQLFFWYCQWLRFQKKMPMFSLEISFLERKKRWVNNKICSRHDRAEILLKLTLKHQSINLLKKRLTNCFTSHELYFSYMTGKSLQTIIRVGNIGPVQRTSVCTCPI